MEEIYKPVPSLNYYYEVSNFGNVRRLERWDDSNPNKKIRHIKEKKVNIVSGLGGHLQCSVTIGWYKSKHVFVKNLIAECFIENPNNYDLVSLKNGNKHDLTVGNIIYVDYQGAILNSYKNGNKKPFTIFKGETNPMAKLNFSDIENIKKHKESGLKYTEIAKNHNVSPRQISNIIRGKYWAIK